MLFPPSLISQICLNYFLPIIISIPSRSVCHASTTGISPASRHMCFLSIADISNLFELFFTHNYLHTLTFRVPCLDYRYVPSVQTHVLFPPSLIFQICLNYFLPKIISIPSRSVCHASTTGMSPATRHICKYHDWCVDTVD